VRKFLMNWKLLLVVATLSLTTSLTACGKKEDAIAPDAKTPETSVPATTETKPVDAMKEGANKAGDAMKDGATKAGDGVKGAVTKTGDAMKDGAAKTGDAMKEGANKAGDAMKGEKPATGTKPADAPKKP
jgi:hypothetical protein